MEVRARNLLRAELARMSDVRTVSRFSLRITVEPSYTLPENIGPKGSKHQGLASLCEIASQSESRQNCRTAGGFQPGDRLF
jgi:hypothetical protein